MQTGKPTGQQTTPPQPAASNAPPPPPQPPKEGNPGLIIMSVITVLSLAAASYFGYQNYLLKKQLEENTLPTPTSTSTPTPTPTGEETLGTITGELCFPSEGIPEGTIVAKDVSTNALSNQDYPGTVAGGTTEYSFDLPAGSFVMKFQPDGDEATVLAGFYTACAKTMAAADCSTDESHQLITVEVVQGATNEDIDLCDFYYGTENKPVF